MLTIREIKQLMKAHNFRPDKRLGQNFVIDRNITDKIIKFAKLDPSDIALEIGAGLGNITTEIAGAVKKVYAIELDERLYAIAHERLSRYKNIEVIRGDILEFDFRDYPAGKNGLKIIANLPYYITTPILAHLIENARFIKEALVMVQKEVGERMLAKPGSKTYSSLSCYLKFYTSMEFKSVVRKTSFFPRPEVDSALIALTILDKPSVAVKDEGRLFKIIRTAFNQRRKTILASLSNKEPLGLTRDDIASTLSRLNISGQARPEQLGLEDFARIANEFPG